MLVERDIERAWLEVTVAQPERTEMDPLRPGTIRAFRTIPERGGRVLRVVYVLSDDTIRVVTAFFDRGQRR
jgi:hypothetical protein